MLRRAMSPGEGQEPEEAPSAGLWEGNSNKQRGSRLHSNIFPHFLYGIKDIGNWQKDNKPGCPLATGKIQLSWSKEQTKKVFCPWEEV